MNMFKDKKLIISIFGMVISGFIGNIHTSPKLDLIDDIGIALLIVSTFFYGRYCAKYMDVKE
jgi:hypothetical protein